MIDLLVHEVPAEEEALCWRQALTALNRENPSPIDAGEGERLEQPVEIVEPIADACHVTVAQEIVCAVHVQGSAHALTQVSESIVAAEQSGDPLCHARGEGLQGLVHFGGWIEQDLLRPQLMMLGVWEHFLEQV